jgi:hypothetical protein
MFSGCTFIAGEALLIPDGVDDYVRDRVQWAIAVAADEQAWVIAFSKLLLR